MFNKIKDGLFDPDAARVSRLFQLAYATMLECQGADDDSGSEAESDASSVASSGGEHDSVAQRPNYKRLEADDMLASEDETFWCGRHPSASFRKATAEDLTATEAVICANCSHAYRAAGHGD